MERKKILLVFILSFMFASNLIGQESFEKGKSMIGGGIGIGSGENETKPEDSLSRKSSQERFSFQVSPYYGKFIKTRLLLGIRTQFSTSKSERKYIETNGTSIAEDKSHLYGGGIFLKKYFPVVEKFGVFFQPGFDYSYSISEHTASDFSNSSQSKNQFSENKTQVVSFDASIGLYCLIGKRFSIETNLGKINLSKSVHKTKSTSSSNEASNVKSNSDNVSLNFINELSFDQIFVINYFF